MALTRNDIKARWVLLFAMLWLCIAGIAQGRARADVTPGVDIHLIRKQLVIALDSRKTTDSLYNRLAAIPDRSSLLSAYMGALEAVKAKHAWNPYSKIKYLNASERTFKAAVAKDPHNIEIRFMRFSIEHNVPGFLGYNKNLTADREEMLRQLELRNYGTADKALTRTIMEFLVHSKRCTPAQQHFLTQQLAAL